MTRKWGVVLVLVLCFGLVLTGCPKTTVMKDEPTGKKSEEAARADAERASREKSEREARESKQKEEARMKEEARTREEARIKEEARAKEEAARREREKEFEKSLVARKQPGIEGEILESRLLKDIRFDFDRYDIRSEDAEILKENAALLAKYPKVRVQIEGHCDERGTAEYNLALGERRANSVKKYLASVGIPENRISTISYGREMPLDPGHNEEAWAKNRRAHFVVLSK